MRLPSSFNRYEKEGVSPEESHRQTSIAVTMRGEEENDELHRSDEASAGFISHIRIQHSSQAKLRAFKKRLVSYQAKAAEWEQYERDYRIFFEQINHYNKHLKKLNLLFPPSSEDLILHLLNIKDLRILPGIN